ncbi:uL15 family ribosomal protein [Candidatus Woesearchaeota archaeon]|nr:uL15 family ribosomal protein [Candidatus Woesearchaeota archaeon]
MVVNKRKRNSRRRGSHTHGWGAMKKHRGAGNRGGRGNAGTGKRADQKKPSIWGDPDYFGKHGFVSKSRAPKINAINLRTIDDSLPAWVAAGLANQNNGVFHIDLTKVGYNKLLGSGALHKKCSITVDFSSEQAIQRCASLGSTVTVRYSQQEKQTKESKAKEPGKSANPASQEAKE